MKRNDPITKKHLIDLLSDTSADLGMLASVMQAQDDELIDCDSDFGGNDDNFKFSENTIIALGNLVENRLKHYSKKFNNISDKEYMTGKYDNK